MKKNLKFSRGFTLVEMLAAVIVLAAIGSIISGIVTTSLRGSNKTNEIETIRQNGNYALSQVSQNIAYAQVFNGFCDNVDDEEEDPVDCDIDDNYIAHCPSYLSPTPVPVTYKYLKVTPSNGSPITYRCDGTVFEAVIPAESILESLVDTAKAVSIDGCVMTCLQTTASDAPIINIKLKLSPKDSAGLNLPESSTPISFESSTTLRNYKR